MGYPGDIFSEMKKGEKDRSQYIEAAAREHEYKKKRKEEWKKELEEETEEEEIASAEEALPIPVLLVARMYKRIDSWALTSAGLGVLSLIVGGLDAGWGLIMIIIAALCWRIKAASMFVLFGVTMAWAALTNGLAALGRGASPLWLAMGLLQLYWVVSLVREYRVYQSLPLQAMYEAKQWPAGFGAPPGGQAVTKWFGIAGMAIGALAFLMLLGPIVINIAWVVSTGTDAPSDVLNYIFVMSPDLAVLSIGLSAAAMATRGGKKVWGVGGVAVGGVTLLLWLALILLT